MNDTELENLLRAMTPAAPSSELAGRVQHDLALVADFRQAAPEERSSLRQPRHWLSNLVWAGLGAAAAVVAMGLSPHTGLAASGPATTANLSQVTAVGSASAVMPVSSTREWVDVEDMGISYATPDSPSRRVKVLSMERHQWIDPRDGAEYTVEVPQEESVVLPMKYQ